MACLGVGIWGGLQQLGEVAGPRGKGKLRQCCHLLVPPAWLSPH